MTFAHRGRLVQGGAGAGAGGWPGAGSNFTCAEARRTLLLGGYFATRLPYAGLNLTVISLNTNYWSGTSKERYNKTPRRVVSCLPSTCHTNHHASCGAPAPAPEQKTNRLCRRSWLKSNAPFAFFTGLCVPSCLAALADASNPALLNTSSEAYRLGAGMLTWAEAHLAAAAQRSDKASPALERDCTSGARLGLGLTPSFVAPLRPPASRALERDCTSGARLGLGRTRLRKVSGKEARRALG